MKFTLTDYSGISTAEISRRVFEKLLPYQSYQANASDWRILFSCIDHTSLDGLDHDHSVDVFCRDVKTLGDRLIPPAHVAAVCVYPVFVRQAAASLRNSDIRIASVAGAFPSGQSPLNVRLAEAGYALDQGADEIDMVISRGRMVHGDFGFIEEEVSRFKNLCGKNSLKVILETGELQDPELIAKASEIALRSGADFLKTSTGKMGVGATLDALLVMMEAIYAYYLETGIKVGIKPSGGIAEPKQALECLLLVKAILGPSWVHPSLFRIGASRLTAKLADQMG